MGERVDRGGPYVVGGPASPCAQVSADATPGRMTSAERSFAGQMSQAAAARRFVAGLLNGSPLADDAVTVTSELVTNALLHSRSGQPGGHLTVRVDHALDSVVIAVTDQGSCVEPARLPQQRPVDGAWHERGRGLLIVCNVALRWEILSDERSTTVRAELAIGQAPPASTGSEVVASSGRSAEDRRSQPRPSQVASIFPQYRRHLRHPLAPNHFRRRNPETRPVR